MQYGCVFNTVELFRLIHESFNPVATFAIRYSNPMHPINSLISLCVMSVLVLFGVIAPFSDASKERTNRFEYLASSAKVGVTMRVLWTVSAYHIGKSAVWGKTEAESMLFKPLDINTSSITFDGQTCHDVIFKGEIVDATQYLAEKFQTTPQTFGFEEKTLEVIKTKCCLPGFSEYMRLMDKRLIVPINGVLFVFEPAVNY